MHTENIFIQRTFRNFLFPTILALLGTTLSSFGNTLLAGRFLGKEALSMMSILSSYTFLYAMLGCLISIGASTKSSHALGSEDYETAAKYEWLSFVLSFVLPILLSIPCIIFFDKLFVLIGAGPEECAIGAVYGRLAIAFGFLNTLMYFPFNFLRLVGQARYGMFCFGAMGIIDLILVYAFLSMGMGPVGLALGYIISMLIANAAGLYFLFSKNKFFKMQRPALSEIPGMLRRIISYGSSSAINNLCKTLRTVSMNIIVSRYLGKEGLASLAVGFSIINLASATVTGFGQAVSPIIGVFHGEHDRDGQRQTLKISIKNAVLFHTALALLIIIFAPQISIAFGITDPAHIKDTALVVRLVAASLIPAAVINILIYYYNAIGENKGARLMTYMHAFVLIVLLTTVHLLIVKSNFYAISFISAELLDILVMYIYSRIRLRQSKHLNGILLESTVFSECFFSITTRGTLDEAVDTSRKVVAFCEENNVSPSLCLKLPLVVEELLVILARHSCENENAQIDLRISLVKNSVVMRLRCMGRIFNPIAWYEKKKAMLTPEKFLEDESFGMNVVEKVVNSVNYSKIFDVNNLIITMGDEENDR